MPSSRSLAAAVASVMLLAAAPPAKSDDADACHQQILRGMAGVARGRIAIVGRCLKDGRYADCPENDLHGIAHENELRNFVAGEKSPCTAATAGGAPLSDFGPSSCAGEWESCDAEVPSIASLDELAECLVCQMRGYDFFLRDAFGLPRPEPADADERRCTRRLARLASHAVRKSIHDAADCASGGGKPFSCLPDASSGSRFGKTLATFERNVAACGIDEGEAPGVLTAFCNGSATDGAGLVACLRGVATCVACRAASSALEQSADCASLSGLPDCDGSF
jgi:hypothetical protein